MKFKKLIGGLLLSSVLAAGLSISFASSRVNAKPKIAEADTTTTLYLDTGSLTWYGNMSRAYLYGSGGNNGWPGQSLTLLSGSIYKLDVTNISNYQYVIFLRSDGNNVWNRTSKDQGTAISLPSDWSTKNMWVFSGWDGNEKDNGNQTGSWSYYDNSYTITKTGVEFNSSGSTKTGQTFDLGSDTVIKGSSYSKPGTPTDRGLGHFVGWYTDSNCTTAMASSITPSSNIIIYAKYTQLETDSYFYWVDKDSTSMANVYFFGEYEPAAWPGLSLSSFAVSPVLNYAGEGKLYKIPCPSSGSYQFIINGGGNQTYDSDVEHHKLLYTFSNGEKYGCSFVDASAADLVARVEQSRNAVPASTGIPQYSICGIAPSVAKGYWNDYYAMPAADKAKVDASYTKTYAGAYHGEPEPAETNVSFSAIMLMLKQIAVNGGQTVNGSIRISVLGSNSGSTIAIIVIASVSLAAVGGYFLFRKKKEN